MKVLVTRMVVKIFIFHLVLVTPDPNFKKSRILPLQRYSVFQQEQFEDHLFLLLSFIVIYHVSMVGESFSLISQKALQKLEVFSSSGGS